MGFEAVASGYVPASIVGALNFHIPPTFVWNSHCFGIPLLLKRKIWRNFHLGDRMLILLSNNIKSCTHPMATTASLNHCLLCHIYPVLQLEERSKLSSFTGVSNFLTV